MHIQRNKVVYKGKVYRSVLLRQCYYEAGKIKQKTIANLSKMPEYLMRSIELAIKGGCQDFCVWLTSFPNLKLNNCLISYSFPFKFGIGFFHLPFSKFSQIK